MQYIPSAFVINYELKGIVIQKTAVLLPSIWNLISIKYLYRGQKLTVLQLIKQSHVYNSTWIFITVPWSQEPASSQYSEQSESKPNPPVLFV
jgi:hypothetical protein